MTTEDVVLTVNSNNPLAQQDYSLIINTYEKGTTSQFSEEAALSSYYKDVYSTRNFSERVSDQINYYPGMHQTTVENEDPAYTEATQDTKNRLNFWSNAMEDPTSYMNALRSTEQDFDYTSIFGTDASAKERATNLGKLLTECVPCFNRKLSLNELLPNKNLLEVHLININGRKDLLNDIKNLFNGSNSAIDICELLSLLSHQCPNDLLAMQILLTQYLAKMNLEINFNFDFIVNLVGPILSPFLDALSQWIDKWMQVILEPMLCVIDSINETIITAQQAKIPFSEAGVSISTDLGAENSSGQTLSYSKEKGWSVDEVDRLKELDYKKYKQPRPEWPQEEIEYSGQEIKESWKSSMSEADREKRNKEWEELRKANREKIAQQQTSTAGTSLKTYTPDYGSYYPPEKQPSVKDSNKYLDPEPLVNSVVQLRNILQASTQYISDWFHYVTQMIYDLLGTDIGWMKKKTGKSFLKSEVLKMIIMITSIIEAWSKNGLECGTSSNFDIAQMQYVFENGINQFSTTQYKVLDSGDIEISTITSNTNTEDNSTTESTETIEEGDSVSIGVEYDPIQTENIQDQQKSTKSSIIVKNCLKNVSSDQIADVRSWIAEYERRYNG